MFVKNLTGTTFKVDINGSKIAITANETTLIPDGIVTIAELQKMFGLRSVLEVTTGPTTSILANQQVAEVGKLYCTEPVTQVEDIRIWVGGAKADIYVSDSATIPTAFTEMSCPTESTGVSGLTNLPIVPRYIAFKGNSGTPEIVVTNLKLHEASSIS